MGFADFAFEKKVLSTFVFTRHLTPRKLVNLARVAWQQLVTRPDVVRGYPLRLVVDPTNLCGLKCPLCPTGQGSAGRPRGMMGFEQFKAIIDEVAGHLFEVELSNWGEPLLNAELPRFIEYASRRNVRVRLSTTLNQLTDELAEALVRAGLGILSVSIDGASKATYTRYRKGGDFDRVLANVRRMADAKTKLGARHPKLVWQFIVFGHNEAEMRDASAKYRSLGFDKLVFRAARSDMGAEIRTPDSEKIERTREWLPSSSALSRYDYKRARRKRRPSNCLFLWTQSIINWNGSMSPCCAIYDEKNDLGNAVAEGSVLKAWNNAAFQRARRAVREKDSAAAGVCAGCLKNGFIEY